MNTEIKGNLQVTRAVSVAGKLVTQGSATVEGNLAIHGWLDAKNIKTPCKGLFATEEDLNDRYPEPMPGWWALVGNTIPAEVFRADGGVWIDTGETGGETAVDLDLYERRLDRLQQDIQAIEHPLESGDTEATADLDISDEDGNVLARFADGHIRTRNFDSANINASGDADVKVAYHTDEADEDVDLDISDADGNVLARFADGHIRTRNFDSSTAGNVLIDRVTGRRYMLCVESGVLSCRLAPIDILIIGNSFTRHAPVADYGWYCSRGMASTVKDNDLVSLLAEGSGGHVEIAMIDGTNCAPFEHSYSTTYALNNFFFDRSRDYGLIIVELNENASYNAGMQASWERLYRWLKELYPNAIVMQLIGWDVTAKTAALSAACHSCGVTLLNNHDLTYTGNLVPGQYVSGNDTSALYPVTRAIITHPSDIGMLLTANRVLETYGYPPLNLMHQILVDPTVQASVRTFNDYPQAVARGVVTLVSTAGTPQVTDALGADVPVRQMTSTLYTFFMPHSTVNITL